MDSMSRSYGMATRLQGRVTANEQFFKSSLIAEQLKFSPAWSYPFLLNIKSWELKC